MRKEIITAIDRDGIEVRIHSLVFNIYKEKINLIDTIKGTDGEFHAVNFKCIPQSSSCKNLFCFLLKHEDGMVLIQKGYLEKL